MSKVQTQAVTSPHASTTEMANAIRALAMDAVQAANSGHPGMPMGMADVAIVLFNDALKFDSKAPEWPNRDRFVCRPVMDRCCSTRCSISPAIPA